MMISKGKMKQKIDKQSKKTLLRGDILHNDRANQAAASLNKGIEVNVSYYQPATALCQQTIGQVLVHAIVIANECCLLN